MRMGAVVAGMIGRVDMGEPGSMPVVIAAFVTMMHSGIGYHVHRHRGGRRLLMTLAARHAHRRSETLYGQRSEEHPEQQDLEQTKHRASIAAAYSLFAGPAKDQNGKHDAAEPERRRVGRTTIPGGNRACFDRRNTTERRHGAIEFPLMTAMRTFASRQDGAMHPHERSHRFRGQSNYRCACRCSLDDLAVTPSCTLE